MLSNVYSHVLNGFLLSVFFVLGLRWVARRYQLIDLPDHRKRHDGEIPLCGGLAILASFLISGFGFEAGYQLRWNWQAGFVMLALIGLADDRWHLSPASRLSTETVAAAILAAGMSGPILMLSDVAGYGPWYLPASFGFVFSIVFIVGLVNAINMIDGVDGLAGASVSASLFWLALISAYVGNAPFALQALVLIAAVLGFLAFNMRHPWRSAASIFLGDAGSTMLGGILATFILYLSSQGCSFPVLLWLVIVPIADTMSLIVRRVMAGRSPLSSDRWHLHHLLIDAGMPAASVAPAIAGATVLCGGVAYTGILYGVADIYLTLGLAVPLLAHTVLVLALQRQFVAVRAVPLPLPSLTTGHHNKEVAG